jgi:hypothetical protein
MRQLVLVVGVLWAASARADEAEVLKGNVLVWHDAALYLEPADDAPLVHVGKLDATRAERVGHAVPMRVVAAKGDFVEVELVDDAQCTWTRLASNDDITKLHFFVKRADLAPVLTKPFDKTFPDGTHIALRPGVALSPGADGKMFASVRGRAVEVDVPAASVGHAYTPERASAPAIGAHDYVLAADAKPTLGDRAVAFDGLHASKIEDKGDVTLMTFDDRCTSVSIAAAKKSVQTTDEEQDAVGGGSGFGVFDLRGADYIPAATMLSTVHGRPFAASAKPIYLMDQPRTKTVCVDRRVRLEPMTAWAPAIDSDDVDDRFRACAPTSKVVHERVRTATASTGTTSR